MASSAIQAVKKELDVRLPTAKVRAIDTKAKADSFMDMLGVFQSNPPARGTTEMLKSYSHMPWLRAVVDKVGSSVATVTWRVFVKTKEGEKGKRVPVKARQVQFMRADVRKKELARLKAAGELVEIEDYPLIDALYAIGPSFTGYTNRELTQKWLDLVGEAFWIKERNGAGMPVNFIPVPPHWVTDTPSGENGVFKLQGPAGTLDDIKAEDMIWFYHPNPADPYGRGSGMGITLGDELETDEYAAKFMKTFFYNSARPDFLITSNELKKEDTTRLEKRWIDKLRGWRRSFLPFFMNRSVEVHTLGTDYAHLSMLDLRKNQRDAVIQVYGVPPETLGIVEASNRATSEVAEYLYARWVLTPRLEFMRQTLQHRLVPDYDDRLILDYDSPVAQDKEHILKTATVSPWALMIDEWREMMGKLALPDGKGQVFMKPLNYEAVLLDDLGEPYSQQDGNGDDDDTGNDDPPADDDPPEDEPEDEPVEEMIRHSWPELIVNQISRQRVSPRVGTRKDQMQSAIYDAVCDIASRTRERTDELVAMLEGGEDPSDVCARILGKTVIDDAMDPVVAKATSVYVLAAEQAKANLVLFAGDEAEIDGLEPLYELMGAKATAEGAVIQAISNTLDVIGELALDWNPEPLVDLLADGIGIGLEDAEEFVECNGEGDAVVLMVSKFTHALADHVISHMCNRAQEALWSEAARMGIIDSDAVSRIWITRLDCRSCNECSGMDGTTTAISGSWELAKDGTVDTPTESHPECHCTEQLVRKEVQREAAK
jgi:hypothetical protein